MPPIEQFSKFFTQENSYYYTCETQLRRAVFPFAAQAAQSVHHKAEAKR
jgi:hypothetical protein